jgi:serine/threonine protein kinase
VGEVYLAQDTKLDRKVELKILPPQFAEDKGPMNLFVAEAKATSDQTSSLYEISEKQGTRFIATKFIDGQTLNDYAKSNPLQLQNCVGDRLRWMKDTPPALIVLRGKHVRHFRFHCCGRRLGRSGDRGPAI